MLAAPRAAQAAAASGAAQDPRNPLASQAGRGAVVLGAVRGQARPGMPAVARPWN